jgi:rare lipoprotein A (peptidoglycan hydrolase)
MNPEDFNYFQSRVTKFISGSTRRSGFGSFLSPKITRLSGIIPKRALPSQIFSRPTASADDAIESSGRGISSLGRVTLDLEIINNNLDRIRQIIEQDYKNTQEINRKETEDFRKRVANRGRIFGKKELGDKKTDVLGAVKKYVGSFFSGTGGAIRALAMFNLLQGILSGDPSKVIGPLLGIGLTYIPAIATGIAGAIATSLVGKVFGGGGARAATAAAPAASAGRFAGMRGLAGRTALVGGGLALANSIFNRPQQDTQQQRLEELTQQQKGLTDAQGLVPVPQDDLKRFENLNKRFEAALDFLMGKKGQQQPQTPSGGGGGGGPAPTQTPQNVVATGQSVDVGGGISYYGPGFAGNPTASGETFNPNDLTAAHQTLPFGTLLKVTNHDTGKSVVVRVNDRGPFVGNRQLDLSEGAMRALGGIGTGVLKNASIEVVKAAGPTQPTQTPVVPSPTTAPRAQRNIPAPQGPNITLVPADTGNQTPSSVASPSNHSAISVDTTHPENFLALYSKLIYQVV